MTLQITRVYQAVEPDLLRRIKLDVGSSNMRQLDEFRRGPGEVVLSSVKQRKPHLFLQWTLAELRGKEYTAMVERLDSSGFSSFSWHRSLTEVARDSTLLGSTLHFGEYDHLAENDGRTEVVLPDPTHRPGEEVRASDTPQQRAREKQREVEAKRRQELAAIDQGRARLRRKREAEERRKVKIAARLAAEKEQDEQREVRKATNEVAKKKRQAVAKKAKQRKAIDKEQREKQFKAWLVAAKKKTKDMVGVSPSRVTTSYTANYGGSHIGSFSCHIAAAQARDEAARAAGATRMNFPNENEKAKSQPMDPATCKKNKEIAAQFIGVYARPHTHKFQARFRKKSLGYFDTAEEAARVHDDVARAAGKTNLNFLTGDDFADDPPWLRENKLIAAKFIGVYARPATRKFAARYADRPLGYFDSAEDAARARDEAAIAAGATQKLNFPAS